MSSEILSAGYVSLNRTPSFEPERRFSHQPRTWAIAALLFCLCAKAARSEIVINEIHYNPDIKTDRVEFVELYNSGSNRVDLTSWSLRGGVDFVFTNAASIAPDGYVVIAQDPAALGQKFGVTNAFGPWAGRLSNESDDVVLRNNRGEVVDEVTYQCGFPWPTVGDLPGHSIELINPHLDNNLGGSWRSSTEGGTPISGQTLLPIGSDWKYFKGTAAPSSPAGAWRAPGFDDSSWASGPGPIGFGDPSIATVLDDMQSQFSSVFFRKQFVLEDPNLADLVLDLMIDDGIRLWINGTMIISFNLPNTTEVAYTATATSSMDFGGYLVVPIPDLNRLLHAGTNLITAQVHNASLGNSDFAFDLGLRTQPGIDPRGATPGARNSVYAESAPPQVRQVRHQPEQPRSGQPVLVTAKVTDPDGVASVQLQYQVNDPGAYIELRDPEFEQNWVSLPMNDAGEGPDLIPGDAVYSAQLPASLQLHRRLIRYRIVATDQGGRSIRLPYPDDPQPNFAYFVYDGVPGWSGAIQPKSTNPDRNTPVTYDDQVMGRLPAYHLIAKKESVRQTTWPTANEQNWGSQYLFTGTLVYDGQVYDHVGYRARGGSWRYSMGKNMWKFAFNRGHGFQARDNYGRKYNFPWRRLNLGACIQQGDYLHRGEQGMFESVGFRLFNLAGTEAPNTHFVQLRIIDEAQESDPTNQYAGDFWGLYLAVEEEDGRFLDEHGLPDANLYKMEGGTGELNNEGPTGPTDKSDLDSFISTYTRTAPDDWWRENFDLDRYYGYQAIVQGIHHYDICALKNYFYYYNPATHLWSVHPWDIDLTWANNMYDSGCGGTDEFKNRVLNRTSFRPEYQSRVREVRDLLFNTNQTWRLIDEYAAIINDPTGGPGFVDADRAMWDYNPVMANAKIVTPSKAGQGRFYQAAPTKDFPGMVKLMKDYIVTRGTYLDNIANDPLIPETPTLTSSRGQVIPANRLTFQCSPYAGTNSFAAMKWRLGEVTPPDRPPFDPAEPVHYEINTIWETAELPAFTDTATVPSLAVKAGHTYRVRARVQDSTGRWSHWSAPIEFVVAAPETVSGEDSLRVTEIMYQPTGSGEFEFVELHNSSSADPIDLSGAEFVQGIAFTFRAGSIIPPGGYLLVARSAPADNFASFRTHYRLGADVSIMGPYSGALGNGGELITLRSAAGRDLFSFSYGDGWGWPLAAAGAGHSLVPVDLDLSPSPNLDYPGSWRASTYLNGSPGQVDPAAAVGVVLNEIAANTGSLSLDSNDWIELFNASATAADLSNGWFLSDDPTNLKKWQIPGGTVVQPHAWVTFDEATGFHSQSSAGFGLSKNGEQVFLSHLTGASGDRVVDCVRFAAQESGTSLGRSPDGVGSWLQLSSPTRSAANSSPLAHVVINEIMFHPQPTVEDVDPDSGFEYVELYNPTSAPVALFNSAGVWRFDGGIQFLFPLNTTLPSGGTLLVVNFDPANAAALSAFKNAYGLGNSTAPACGPFSGKLNNSSDRIALEKPEHSDQTNLPPGWVLVDEVIYSDRQPWPIGADGAGLALHRIGLSGSGDESANWSAALPTPGAPALVAQADSDGDGMPDDWERAHGLDPHAAADAALDVDGDGVPNLVEYQAGTDPQNAASALRLTASFSANGGAHLRFTAAAHKSYRVWWCESLRVSSWELLQSVPAGDATRQVEIVEPAMGAARYYRLELRSAW